MRNLRKKALADQLKYRKPKKAVEEWFAARDIPIATEIWITPLYPNGWEAVLGAWERVWIMRNDRGDIYIKDIQHVVGFNPNGTLIVS